MGIVTFCTLMFNDFVATGWEDSLFHFAIRLRVMGFRLALLLSKSLFPAYNTRHFPGPFLRTDVNMTTSSSVLAYLAVGTGLNWIIF